MSRSEIARLRATVAAMRGTTGGGSWLRAMRHGPPPTLAQLATLPGPLAARFPKPPARKPAPGASVMARALAQVAGWEHARATAADQARAQGRDPVAAMASVGELADFGAAAPTGATRKPASATAAPEAPSASPKPLRAVQRVPVGPYDASEGDAKMLAFNNRRRALGLLPPL